MAVSYILLCMFISFFSVCKAGVWETIPFTDADQVDVQFVSSTETETRIQMLEERVGSTKIAIVNFVGTDASDLPVITSFEEGKNNEMLGADYLMEGGVMYLVITKKQDYEDSRQQRYGFYYDTTGDGGVGHRVNLNIKNINDNPPVIAPETSSCVIVENRIYTESDCTFKVNDIDGGDDWPFDSMEYGITDPDKATSLFGLRFLANIDRYNARATLTVGTPGLDFEEFSLHIIELFVNDEVGGNKGTTSYVVRVEDVADEPPIWKTAIVQQTLLEEETHTMKVTAVDGDIGINAPISYRIEYETPEDAEYFSIDSNGTISVAAIDRDKLESDIFILTLVAYEVLDETSLVKGEMYIIIKDINDHTPTIVADSLAIAINEETALQLELNIAVLDPDLADFGSFTIELQDKTGHEWNKNFLLIPKNGYQDTGVTISVTNPSALDYENETMRVITLQLVATEKSNSSHIDSQDIIITLIDLNDEFPFFDLPEYNASIEENSKQGAYIITMLAIDPDAGDVVTHTLTSQLAIMRLDALTGVVTVASDTSFDYERQTTVVVQVLAQDNMTHKTYVQLTVEVIDVNDVQPDLTMPSTPPKVEENKIVGTDIVALITAHDVDTEAVLEFSIDWSASFATKQGATVRDLELFTDCIEISTSYPDALDTGRANGNLKVKLAILDYEAYDTLTLSIRVTDLTTAPEYPQSKSRSALLAVQLDDVNDNAPVFTNDSVTAIRSVIEGSRTNWLIGSVIATDKDGPGNNDVTYSITEADPRLPPNLVKIDTLKGELRVDADKAIDCDVDYEDKLLYTITATDGTWNTTLMIVIDIIDQNNKVPQFLAPEIEFSIWENSPTGVFIGNVSGFDQDFAVPYHTISYFLNPFLNPTIIDFFTIDEDTGEIAVKLNDALGSVLDRETTPSYVIPIVLRDNYNQPDSNSAISLINDTLKITLNLWDENDNDPILEVIEGCIERITDNAPVGTSIRPAGILATDADDEDNGRVTFSIVSVERVPDGFPITPPPEAMFSINTVNNTGFLKTLISVKNVWGTYLVTLMAKDHGPSGDERNGTGTYRVCILPMNDYPPVITYPKESETIRILLNQELNGPLVDSENKPLKDFSATDQDLYGDNAKVDLTLAGNDLAKEYFQLVDRSDVTPNTAQLRLKKELIETERVFLLDIVARDNGESPKESQIVAKVVVIIRMGVEPEFERELFDGMFMENSLTASTTIPEAKDEDNFELADTDDLWQPVYYYIIGTEVDTPGLRFFSLDPTTRLLTLAESLDREEYDSHTLYILTTNNPVKPPNAVVNPSSPSQLVVNITVGDENDNPPKFESELNPGGVSKEDKNGKVVTTILAHDPDLDDIIVYKLVENTMYISDSSLDNVKDNAFILTPGVSQGTQLILNFDPDVTMKGFFMFNITANDKIGGPGHEDFAVVKIYMIADSNRVTFKFLNRKTEVENQKIKVQEVFTLVLEMDCSVDSIFLKTDSSGIVMEDQTYVIAHFINADEPVEDTVISDLLNDRDVTLRLKQEFLGLEPKLDFVDYEANDTATPQDIEQLLRIILIVVSVVLGTLVILLFAAFFIRTRSLNRRLEALSTTKFGSQDSGLNRMGVSMPGANKRALEGSNPVWNEDIHAKDFDDVSQGSYDSELIGVEENPEFNTQQRPVYDNIAYDMEARPSINPLSNGGHTMAHPVENFGGQDSNFSYSSPADDPITDL